MNIWRFIAAGLKLILRRPLVGTTMIPVLPDGQILLARRRDTGQWSLPGGMLDWGEDLTRCSRRELLEETGFELTNVSRLVGVYSSLGRDPRFHAVSVAIAVAVAPTSTKIQDFDEILEVKPFEPSAIPQNNLSHDHAQILRDYLDGKTVVA
ncbi:NUDIX hydrolase [[Limnothrix rosea] IAM M-220]|uniref:NUDIX hydrolase n=1 Tax=[Limnothrix rosea] IAM M-220 TaxID=454133 RepID=UPI000966E12E|nr:NUDIX hydrolase [[Limnothrix rosea] IAM M-220]OKH18476.1 NUDIX hydrolase [[Limnothrix rosea] IAM M-220]